MAFLNVLSRDEFGSEVDKDSEFGLKVALLAKIIEHDRVSTLNADQKKLFNNYGLLRLLGCKVGYVGQTYTELYNQPPDQQINGVISRTELGLKVGKRVRFQSSHPNAQIPPAVTLDRLLELSHEEAQVFEDENIFNLVDLGKLPFERALELTKQEFERLRVKTSEPSPLGDRASQHKPDYSHLFTTGRVDVEPALAFLTTIPEDYWPDPYFVMQIFKKIQPTKLDLKSSVLAIASLPVDHLNALTKHKQGQDFRVLNGIVSLAQPIEALSCREAGYPILRPALLEIQQLSEYTPDQVVSIGLACDGIRSGFIAIQEASGLNAEQAQVANALSRITLWAPDKGIEQITHGQVCKADIYTLNVGEASALSMLSFLLEEKLATAAQIKVLAKHESLVEIIKEIDQATMTEFFRAYQQDAIKLLGSLNQDSQDRLYQALEYIAHETDLPAKAKAKAVYAALTGGSSQNLEERPEPEIGPV